MITIYNEHHDASENEDQKLRDYIQNFFKQNSFLRLTNILVWIKEINPARSRGNEMYECSIEARIPNKEPIYVSKKNSQVFLGIKEVLENVKEEILESNKKYRNKRTIFSRRIEH